MANNFLGASHGADKLYQFSGFTTTINASIVKTDPAGIVWDGTDIYWGDVAGKCSRGTGFGGTVQSSFTITGAPTVYGLDFIGTNLIHVESNTKVYQHTGFSSTIDSSFAIVGADFRGVAYDGTNVLTVDVTKVRKHSGFTTTILDSFTSAGAGFDCTWDGTNVYVQEIATVRQYRQYSGFSSTVNSSFNYPVDTPSIGIDWEGFPVPVVGPANLKTWNTLAKASVKTVNGLAIASVKTFNGLA